MTAIKVIYIIGAAHSGSTILGAILGTHPNLLDAGELYSHGERVLDSTKVKCSCGETLALCPFWSAVWQDWQARFPNVSVQAYHSRMASYQRLRALARLSLHQLVPSRDFRTYQAEAVGMIESAISVGHKPSLVDVSKSPIRGLALATLPEIDLRLVHLVRNGLAMIASVYKHHGQKWSQQGMSQKEITVKATNSWLSANLGAEYVIWASKRPATRIRYEDLIAAPEKTIRSLSKTFGEDLSDIALRVAAGEPISFGHARGNIVGRNGPHPLVAREDWRTNLSREAQGAFSRRAGWLNRHYGYSRESADKSSIISVRPQ